MRCKHCHEDIVEDDPTYRNFYVRWMNCQHVHASTGSHYCQYENCWNYNLATPEED